MRIQSIRNIGAIKKFDHKTIGFNNRMDTIQAAILIEKLKIFPRELEQRAEVACLYSKLLSDVCPVPNLADSNTSAWAQYTLRLPGRNRVQSSLKSFGIPSVVYYPIPLSKQIGYQSLPCVSNGVLVSERLAEKVLSLPMHPYLKNDAQLSIVEVVKKSLG